MKKLWISLSTVLFWAFLWGIIEATVGCILHLMPIRIGWLFWAPIAFYCMNRVYEKTGKPSFVLCAAFISALIKLIDLFLPMRIDMVINPAVSIILEGLVLFAFYELAIKYPVLENLKTVFVLAINTSWRIFYLLYILLTPGWMIAISPLKSVNSIIEYLLMQNLISSILLYIVFKYEKTFAVSINRWTNSLSIPRFFNRFAINGNVVQVMGIISIFSVDILLKFIL